MIEGHGDDIYRYKRPIISNFSSNVCYAADLSGLREHLYDRFPAVCNYPEPEPFLLERKLAGQHNLPEGSVCVTNGATEAIYLIAQTFRETETAILAPAFSEYADACRMHAHRVSFIYEPESIAANIRMAWICNPNNPTGTVYDIDRLRKLIHRHPQVCFVIDQAYGYFTEKEVFTAEEAASYPNVLLLHSMTKQYAIPGLRLGYITANAGLLRRLRSNRMPWSVNRLAIEAGLYILEKGVPCPLTVSDYLQECRRLKQMLEGFGCMDVWPTDTHFMLVQLRFGKAAALKDYLAGEHGFLIRDASNFEGLNEQFFRIATQSPEENDCLIKHIGQWLQH